MSTQRFLGMALGASLCVGTLGLVGCNQQPAPAPAGPAPASTAPVANAAQQPPAYTPPSADQLYQLVAPIALFPDKLVAQVLAGSTYPDQITAADNLLTRNPNLKGTLLQAAVDPQPWDTSVKGLTLFPSVLDQMAQNADWTKALGEAYVNDPTDVLNAIQVMRQRATAHGSLRNSSHLRVNTQPVAVAAQQPAYVPSDNYPPVYAGPTVVPAPERVIEIEPAQPDTVYVPSYDPETVYGEEIVTYPSYRYVRPSYDTGDVVAAGALSFGVGIVVGALLEHHHHDDDGWRDGGGWHSWGMNWGGGGGYNGGGGDWQRPAVVYNNQTYVSRSTTIINRYTTNNINGNNNNINSNNRNVTVNNSGTINNNHNTVNNNGTINNNRNTFNNANNTVNNIDNSRNPLLQNHNVTNNVNNQQINNHNFLGRAPTPVAPVQAPPALVQAQPGQPAHAQVQPGHMTMPMTMPNFNAAKNPAMMLNSARAVTPQAAPHALASFHPAPPPATPNQTPNQMAQQPHAMPQIQPALRNEPAHNRLNETANNHVPAPAPHQNSMQMLPAVAPIHTAAPLPRPQPIEHAAPLPPRPQPFERAAPPQPRPQPIERMQQAPPVRHEPPPQEAPRPQAPPAAPRQAPPPPPPPHENHPAEQNRPQKAQEPAHHPKADDSHK
ncbi:DUF3300 domain-containing protein [Dyella tabacisoli]|nr:DUF3300 domain-containing protein [Dyella tabacisoli]